VPTQRQQVAAAREERSPQARVEVAQQRRPEAAALERRPVQVRAQASVAQQRPSRRWVQPALAASSPAVARRPCSGRQVGPARQRRPEPVVALAVREQRSVQAEVPVAPPSEAPAAVVSQPRP
jgi:hypothetical protein